MVLVLRVVLGLAGMAGTGIVVCKSGFLFWQIYISVLNNSQSVDQIALRTVHANFQKMPYQSPNLRTGFDAIICSKTLL